MPLYIEISQQAENDLEEIFDYTKDKHGIDQAFTYVSSFDDMFESIADYPEMGRDRREIRTELRSAIKDYHVVFYRVLIDRIRIVRVLHNARDVPRNFNI